MLTSHHVNNTVGENKKKEVRKEARIGKRHREKEQNKEMKYITWSSVHVST